MNALQPLDPLELPLVGTRLIEASAGTGKTYTITSLVLRLLLERGLSIEEIVVVTFTKAATSELRERIRRRIDDAAVAFTTRNPRGDGVLAGLLERCEPERARRRLLRAQRSLDRAAVFTIHGFAQRMLQEHAFESGARFDLELSADQRTLVTEVARDFWSSEIAPLSAELWRLLLQAKKQPNLRGLVNLAYVAAAWPDLPLHGAAVSAESGVAGVESRDDWRSAAPKTAALRRAWDAARTAWREEGADALALLSSAKLHKGHYDAAKVDAYRADLDERFAAGDESRSDSVEKLSSRFIASKALKGHPAPTHRLFDVMQALHDESTDVKAATLHFVDALREHFVDYARRRVQLEHQRGGTQSFDDLLQGLRAALRSGTGPLLEQQVAARYPVALIDEFQDTDPVQYEIFRTLFGRRGAARGRGAVKASAGGAAERALFLIGDPKQAIYAFRGADVFAYLAAARDAADGAYTLSTNYRSDPGLLTALNHLFTRLPDPFLNEGIRYTPVSPRPGAEDRLLRAGQPAPALELVYVERGSERTSLDDAWVQLTAHEVARLLGGGVALREGDVERAVSPRDVAVLTRTNAQAQKIQEHLRALGVPSVLHGDLSVFRAAEAPELLALMGALAEPTNGARVRAALVTELLGVDALGLCRLQEDEDAWEEWVQRFRRGHARWLSSGFVHAIQQLIEETRAAERSLAAPAGERRMTNLRHLIELCHAAECEEHLGVVGLLRWLEEAVADPGGLGMAPDAQQLRLESDDDAVTLTTMHKSKGLEYPIVVLPLLGSKSSPFQSESENLRFHDPDREDALLLDVRVVEHKARELELGEAEHRAEALRLAYVALTRAKHHLVVLWGWTQGVFSSLGYLLHHDPALPADIKARLKGLDDAARCAELEALAAGSQGSIAVRRADQRPGPRLIKPRGGTGELAAALMARRTSAGLRTSSFSAMTRRASELSRRAREGKDVDELDNGAALEALGRRDDERAVTLADFPRGARPGELLHAALEHSRFADSTADERLSVAADQLRRQGMSAELLPALSRGLEEVLATPLDAADPPLRLGALSAAQCVAEMEFMLPVADASAHHFASAHLAQALREALAADTGGPGSAPRERRERLPFEADYVAAVEALDFKAFTGFLRGFIDLVFEHEGRYFVADYKSNHLGGTSADYGVEKLERCMEEHHYYLQYLLYAVAVHRHLARRVTGYDYDQHFGGVYYLFLRGMHPDTGAARGVFFHRPRRALIERLSALLRSPEEPAPALGDGARCGGVA